MMPMRALKLGTHQALLGEGAIDAQGSHREIGELSKILHYGSARRNREGKVILAGSHRFSRL